ncbi:DNA polymerase alpha/epsilon subunit B-domain-containing protein [Gongronella butleri]|nr:DNA polymerase alpha/epsilon subunit B-domain-containing protein [Gongronella butleri]
MTSDEFCTALKKDRSYPELDRASIDYDSLSALNDKFEIKDKTYEKQYASIYFIRLLHLRPIVLERAQQRWESQPENPQYVPKCLDVQANELCYIIGTVYMDMPLKPNVLKDLSDESSLSLPPAPEKYRSEGSTISLEDESGRVRLIGARLDKELLVTGMIVGVLGKEEPVTGAFEVIEVCYPGLPKQNPLPKASKDKYVAIVSGLNIGDHADADLKIQLMLEYITGELGSSEDQASASSIARVILAGNSLATAVPKPQKGTKKRYGYDAASYDDKPLHRLDALMHELCMTTDVDIMPGAQDPVGIHLPQQPMHRFLFNTAKDYSSFHPVSNPHWCQIDGVKFLGTAGQNIDDIYKYLDDVDRLKMASETLFWQHIAPSAPDTLWCHPFQNHDPFLLNECPHVYFIGNQPQFDTTVLEGENKQKVRVVMVPSFAETGTIALVNVSTLECTSLSFNDQFIKAAHDDNAMDES